MPADLSNGEFFKKSLVLFLEDSMLFLLALKWKLQEKRFIRVETKTNSNFAVNLVEILKEETIHFCLFDESNFSDICTYLTIKCIELN